MSRREWSFSMMMCPAPSATTIPAGMMSMRVLSVCVERSMSAERAIRRRAWTSSVTSRAMISTRSICLVLSCSGTWSMSQ